MSRAVLLTGFGAPEVLQLGDVVVPNPAPTQIRVAVHFAGVWTYRCGHQIWAPARRLPGIPRIGTRLRGGTGVVDAVGADVSDVRPGDDVAVFLPGLGGYAEHVLADFWVPKSAEVDWGKRRQLSPAAGEAAVRVLNQLDVQPGEKLLVLGAAGSVGTVAVQLAVARDVTVIAAVRRDDFGAAQSLGAIPVLYRRTPRRTRSGPPSAASTRSWTQQPPATCGRQPNWPAALPRASPSATQLRNRSAPACPGPSPRRSRPHFPKS